MDLKEFEKLKKFEEIVHDLWVFVYDLRSSGVEKVEYDYEGLHHVVSANDVLLSLNDASIFLSELKLKESKLLVK